MMERWPRVDGAGSSLLPDATCKHSPEDFQVTELAAAEFSDSGEHLYGFVEKTNLTTREVAQQLAALAGVAADDVGYAGMKDKRARTRQWFSVPTKRDDLYAELCEASISSGLTVLECRRHNRKLRRGQLDGNRFQITLRALQDSIDPERVARLIKEGVPNYFGAQRFGEDNLEQAQSWLAKRRQVRISSFKKGLYLSVLRSFIFNEVLAHRVVDASWNQLLDGDVALADSPTGPLWGRGRSAVSGRAGELERQALADHQALVEDLEYAGVNQQRRALILRPAGFELNPGEDDSATLSFELPAGAYATVVLRELVTLDDGHVDVSQADSPVVSNRAAF